MIWIDNFDKKEQDMGVMQKWMTRSTYRCSFLLLKNGRRGLNHL